MTKIILGIDIGACGALAVLSDGEHLHQKRCRWMRFWKIPWVAGSEFYKLMRSAEMKGIATNDTLRDHFTDLAYSYITAFQGKLTPNDLMTFARRGGTAFKNLDMDKDLGAFSVIAADVGGSKAGTALQTLQQLQLGAATMSKQQYSIYEQAGLIDPSKAHPTGFGGGKMQLDPGAIKGSLENVGHLAEWIETIIHPALMKLAHGDNNLYEALLGKAMPNRNAAGMAQMLGDPGFLDQRMKDIGLSKEALKSGAAYDTFTKDDPTGVKKKFDAQYEFDDAGDWCADHASRTACHDSRDGILYECRRLCQCSPRFDESARGWLRRDQRGLACSRDCSRRERPCGSVGCQRLVSAGHCRGWRCRRDRVGWVRS